MINIVGPVNQLGYGIHTCNMLKALVDSGEETTINLIGEKANGYYNNYLEGRVNTNTDVSSDSPTIHIFHDEMLDTVCGRPLAAFSIFETTLRSQKAIDNLNTVPDMIFTTTDLHKELLRTNEVTKPIHIVHEGVDPELFNMNDSKPAIETGKFTYILVGKQEKRKNTNLIIHSWIASMQYEEAALICHTHNPFMKADGLLQWCSFPVQALGYKTVEETDIYIKVSNGISDIYFTKPVFPMESMKSLYMSANVGISCSRAEGWNLPLMELMACGIPTITTNVIGHSEYLPGAPAIQQDLVIDSVDIETANDGMWFNGTQGSWAVISPEDIAECIEDVFDNSSYKLRNKKLSDYIIDNYNWSLAATRVKELIL